MVGRLAGHTGYITSLAFPSYLVSVSTDKSVKFWQSSSFLAESKSTDHITALQGSTRVMSVNLFAEDGTVVTSDESGVVKTWDLITGRCGSSFSSPAEGPRDTYMADDALILVWRGVKEEAGWYHFWDVGKGRLLKRFRSSFCWIDDVKISGDGSGILGVHDGRVEVMSMRTGKITGDLGITVGWVGPFRLCVRGSQVGINNLCRFGWDFGGWKVSDFGPLSNQLRLDLVDPPSISRGLIGRPIIRWIMDTVTGRQVFRLPERYMDPSMEVLWDGQYLLIWSPSGEVVVVDFDCVAQTFPTAPSDAFSKLANLF